VVKDFYGDMTHKEFLYWESVATAFAKARKEGGQRQHQTSDPPGDVPVRKAEGDAPPGPGNKPSLPPSKPHASASSYSEGSSTGRRESGI
jgi:hypothetical protein